MKEPTQQARYDDGRFPGPIAWMAQHSIAANLLMILLIGGGIWTAFNIQKEVYPQFDLDVINVSVSYPGAAPSEVEQGILRPVESAIRGIEGIKVISSRAREGSGTTSIELVTGTDRMKAFQDIDQAVNRIRTFPDEAEKPVVEEEIDEPAEENEEDELEENGGDDDDDADDDDDEDEIEPGGDDDGPDEVEPDDDDVRCVHGAAQPSGRISPNPDHCPTRGSMKMS